MFFYENSVEYVLEIFPFSDSENKFVTVNLYLNETP